MHIVNHADFGDEVFAPYTMVANGFAFEQVIDLVLTKAQDLCDLFGGHNVRVIFQHSGTPLERHIGVVGEHLVDATFLKTPQERLPCFGFVYLRFSILLFHRDITDDVDR